MSKNRYAAGGHFVRAERLRAGGAARGGRASDGTRARRARSQRMVLAEDPLLEQEDGVGAGREGAEDDQTSPNALLLRWIRSEFHGKPLHTDSTR